jgi:hypothetical protein
MANVSLTFNVPAAKLTVAKEVFDAVGQGAQGMFPATIVDGEINPDTGTPIAYCSSGVIDDQNPVVLGRAAVKAALAESSVTEADIDEVYDVLDVTPSDARQRAREVSAEVDRTIAAQPYEPGVYQAGEMRSVGSVVWVNLSDNNSFAPGIFGWRQVWGTSSETSPQWVQPAGREDSYQIGEQASDNGKEYVNERANNVSRPGTFDSGWRELAPTLEDWKQPGTVIPGSSPPAVYPAYDQDYRYSSDPNDTQVVEVRHPNEQDSDNIWKFRSKIAANTTEPGKDGTFHRYWEPVERL